MQTIATAHRRLLVRAGLAIGCMPRLRRRRRSRSR